MGLLESRFFLEPEADFHAQFSSMAKELFCNWVLEKDGERYMVTEAEFYARTIDDTHADPFLHNLEIQKKFGHWFLHSSGVDLTLGRNDLYFSVFIRSIKSLGKNTLYNGPWKVFQQLFEDAGIAYNPEGYVKLVPYDQDHGCPLISVPRVYLSLVEDSKDIEDRLRFAFRPYRFVKTDAEDFSEKYLAYLYLDRVRGEAPSMELEKKIYDKYLYHFDKGRTARELAEVWKTTSRLHRMAALMGYLHVRKSL